MAIRKSNKLNTMSYALTIKSRDPIQEHYGTILGVTDHAVIIEQKRPRTSRFEVVFVPKSSIIYWHGVVSAEGGGYICRRVPMGTELFNDPKNTAVNIEENSDGTLSITLEDGTILHVSGSDVSLVAQQEVQKAPAEAPRRAPRQAAEKAPVEAPTAVRRTRRAATPASA